MLHKLTTLAAAAAPAAAATTPAPPVLRVMPLGDSITDGYLTSSYAGYRLPLWQKSQTHSRLRVDFVGSRQSCSAPDSDNEAHGATMINGFRGKAPEWVRRAEPDVVLLHHGVNDHDRGTDKANAPARLAAVADEILAARPGVTVVVMGLIPTSSFGRRLEAALLPGALRLCGEQVDQAAERVQCAIVGRNSSSPSDGSRSLLVSGEQTGDVPLQLSSRKISRAELGLLPAGSA
ncbi:GDSL-type esterase/lipase family protein [Streptomyces sp. NPDC054932]